MIYVGLDDTDMPETPGTNKLAMHLSRLLARQYTTRWIVRHQMFNHPQVPCTNRNGGVSLGLEPRGRADLNQLIDAIRQVMLPWCPPGSDPGLCVTQHVPPEVCQWGQRAQREVLEKNDALALAESCNIHLEPLGGTGGGVIGALAAVGLLALENSGRVVHRGMGSTQSETQSFDVTGTLTLSDILSRGVDRVLNRGTGEPITSGSVDLGKRLRPNLRRGQVVLYVLPAESDCSADWQAQRVVE